MTTKGSKSDLGSWTALIAINNGSDRADIRTGIIRLHLRASGTARALYIRVVTVAGKPIFTPVGKVFTFCKHSRQYRVRRVPQKRSQHSPL